MTTHNTGIDEELWFESLENIEKDLVETFKQYAMSDPKSFWSGTDVLFTEAARQFSLRIQANNRRYYAKHTERAVLEARIDERKKFHKREMQRQRSDGGKYYHCPGCSFSAGHAKWCRFSPDTLTQQLSQLEKK